MFWPFVVATVLVALAELGDKTQMLSLVLAARYRTYQVFLGVGAAVIALQALAVVAGGAVGALLPARLVGVAAGTLFVVFGVVALRSSGDTGGEHDQDGGSGPSRLGVIAGVFGAFFLAELGDKTQLMTMSIAADPFAAGRVIPGFAGVVSAPSTTSYIAVWLGSTLGMMLVNGVAIAVGAALGSRLSPRLIAKVSGITFIIFGIATLVSAFLGS